MREAKAGDVIKSKGQRYEVEYVVHSTAGVDGDDTYACHRLSWYDGMPVGGLVWVAKRDIDPGEGRER